MITRHAPADLTRSPLLLLAIATLVCLLPFVGKAYNIDEPLFIWVARHIQSSPLDFYGFSINWYGMEMRAAEIIKNPPLASYYIAVAGRLLGWNETSLHFAFLLPAFLAITGTYYLARELSHHPLTATLICLLTPVFILSAATVMCDTMMLALYAWAVFLWIRGMRSNSSATLLLAAVLIGLCSLTKYFGMCLIPLLFAYTVSGKRGLHRVLFLLVPIIILFLYQWGTRELYGRGLLFDAASYAHAAKAYKVKDVLSSLITGLSFFGGCFIPTLFFAPALWGKREAIAAVAVIPLLALGLSRLPFPAPPGSVSWGYYLQLSLFIGAALHILALAVADLWQKRDADSLLLLLWVTGTFAFASFVNWSVNGRSILPMAPAVGVLIVRALERRGFSLEETIMLGSGRFAVPLIGAWCISMAVTWSDYSLAETARTAARKITGSYGFARPVIFQGHWGFQYYMEQNGAVAWDRNRGHARPAIMAMPANNTNTSPEIMAQGSRLLELELAPAPFLTTMNLTLNAGFYSSVRGALPFAFGIVPDEKYTVARLE